MEKRYWAFISYSHYDKRIAQWLKLALSKQKIPSQFRCLVASTSSRLDSVFLDTQEAAASSNLTEEIKRGLDQSLRLIVICSPYAVSSEYVSAEVEYFLSQGRRSDIICVIASGIPNSTDANKPNLECFPRPLRLRTDNNGLITKETLPIPDRPIGAALGDESKVERSNVIQQVTAGIFGISRSQLGIHLKRRARIRFALGFISICIVAAIGLAFWDHYYRTTIHYFDAFTKRNGVWQGLGKLSEEEAASRNQVFVFYRHGRRSDPDMIKFLNGSQACQEPGLLSILGDPLVNGCSSRFACGIRFEYRFDKKGLREEALEPIPVGLWYAR
jgi:hypothetical protein